MILSRQSVPTDDAYDKLIYLHGVGGSKEPDIEIAHHMWVKDDIGKALYSRAEFESACYGEWKKSHPDSKQLDKNGELKVYRKGDRINGVECWTINEDGADMGQGSIGIDHRSTLEQLQREGYVCISGFGTMSGGSGEGEVAFVKPTKAPEKRRKTAQSLSGAEKEAADKDIRALKDRHAKMMSDYQTEFMNAAQSGNMEALTAMPQKFAEKMRAFQESVDAIADKYGIIINEAGASGKIASTKQDGNYDESDQNRYNSVTSLDKSSTSGRIKLENPNTDGGPGSGNFGHEGRLGEVGGSAPASGGAGSSSKSESSGSSGGSGGSGSSGGSGGKASSNSGKAKTGASSSGSGAAESVKSAGRAKSGESSAAESSSASKSPSKSPASSSEQKKGGEAESGSSSSSASGNATSPSSTVSATGSNHFEKGFSKSNLRAHWGGSHGHKDQYPDMTKQEYAERALDLIQKPTGDTILGYKNANGQIVRYDKSTNDFVKGKPDMGIATMFKPKGGEAYFNRCLDKEGVKDE